MKGNTMMTTTTAEGEYEVRRHDANCEESELLTMNTDGRVVRYVHCEDNYIAIMFRDGSRLRVEPTYVPENPSHPLPFRRQVLQGNWEERYPEDAYEPGDGLICWIRRYVAQPFWEIFSRLI
jgi:hypothetical protein